MAALKADSGILGYSFSLAAPLTAAKCIQISRLVQMLASEHRSHISPRFTTHILQVGAPNSAATWVAIRPRARSRFGPRAISSKILDVLSSLVDSMTLTVW